MKYLANLHRGLFFGVFAAATLVGCSGDGSSATTSASGAPAAITAGTQPSSSGSAALSWTAPTENTDGSVLADLRGYVIHYGTVANELTSSITINNPGVTTYVVDNLAAGTYYFTLSATATGGVQSVESNVAATTIS